MERKRDWPGVIVKETNISRTFEKSKVLSKLSLKQANFLARERKQMMHNKMTKHSVFIAFHFYVRTVGIRCKQPFYQLFWSLNHVVTLRSFFDFA